MRTSLATVIALLLTVTGAGAQTPAGDTLDIYVIDVEGGNATLFVSPSGDSLLIDTGNGGAAAGRDAGRIMAAIEDAGLDTIDHLITTHWHGDHFGGMTELASRIPIRNFIDHGPNVQPNPAIDAFLETTYPDLWDGAEHTVAEPGDTIAVSGLAINVLASGGRVVEDAVQLAHASAQDAIEAQQQRRGHPAPADLAGQLEQVDRRPLGTVGMELDVAGGVDREEALGPLGYVVQRLAVQMVPLRHGLAGSGAPV